MGIGNRPDGAKGKGGRSPVACAAPPLVKSRPDTSG